MFQSDFFRYKQCHFMKNKHSTPTPQEPSKKSTKKVEAKPVRPSGRTVAAELASELANVSIVEVAKIAAQLRGPV